ncbi:MAG: hydrogenase expression/formation protein HypE [Deltaproteobacteria bacterium]|nr:hydrogenase expression/formation protein HypE [Deltaproteobacteria bacterium]
MSVQGTITLDHGEGGAATSRLVRDVFLRHLGGPEVLEDAAIVAGAERIALTTDTFVVRPSVFPGGDIGKLAVCGTVNDLAVMGAEPRYLSAGFILEEGLEIALLEQVVASMAATAAEACVRIVTGDTKVVARGEADGLYVNTSGVGVMPAGRTLSSASCEPGDAVLVSGSIGEHGTAVMVAREGFGMTGDFKSDCQPLGDLARALLAAAPGVRCMRDPTRGGLATTLVEIALASKVEIRLREETIPVRGAVRGACELLGLDPLYVACEGRLIAVVPADQADAALGALRSHPRGAGAASIGEVREGKGLVLDTRVGGLRPLIALEGAQLPRIC